MSLAHVLGILALAVAAGLAIPGAVLAAMRQRRERAKAEVTKRGRWPRCQVQDALDREERSARREIREGARAYLRATGGDA